MRHVLSLIYGLFGTLVAWLAAAIGATALVYANAPGEVPGDVWAKTKLIGYAGLVVAGLILGFLATLRLSPAGPILAGVLLLAGQAVYENKPSLFQMAWLTDGLKLPKEALVYPASMYAPVIVGVILLTAAASAARWQTPKKETPAPTDYLASEPPLGSGYDPYGQQPIDPFAPQAPTYEPAPAVPSQPSMYVDDGESPTTMLPPPAGQKPQPPQYPHQ
ncbi:hypothetical protein Afil01_11180 [Actinorhabdospora filicis]|uniref:Uncharacterized protein n=1 Tax=Actinorhabdospora filicis TaxID=1785913 RepID=A0A9W6W8B6_9ACTN|nr:hypothetical protein [Actinorhabdospora filicis]GLZ76311.1 hypothetical protein Afil01_11180 [Actinorhabdospora filicis]